MKKIKYSEIREIFKSNSIDVISNINDETLFRTINSLSNSNEEDLSFFSNKKYLDDLKKCKAKACIINKKYSEYLPNNCQSIIVNDPYLAFALITDIFFTNVDNSNGIVSGDVIISKYSKIHNNVQIDNSTFMKKYK